MTLLIIAAIAGALSATAAAVRTSLKPALAEIPVMTKRGEELNRRR